MSTVLFYNHVLYADRRVSSTELTYNSGKTFPSSYSVGHKMFQHGNMVYAITGNIDGWFYFQYRYLMPLFFQWLDMILCWKVPRSWIIGYDGKQLVIYNYRSKKILGINFSWWKKTVVNKINDDTVLWMGSGGDYVIDAIDLGLTPFEAMCYAADRDPYSDYNLEYTNFHEDCINKIVIKKDNKIITRNSLVNAYTVGYAKCLWKF